MLLIDGNYFARRFFHIAKIDGEDVAPNMFRYLFLENLVRVKRKFKTYGRVVICVDWSSWRYEYYKDYKNKRKEKNKSDDMLEFYNIYNELLDLIKRNTNIVVLSVKKVEADDSIYLLSKIKGEEHIVYSGDKDLAQTISDNVKFYDFNLKDFLIYDKERLEYNMLYHILKGDISDDIPNILDKTETTKEFDNWLSKKHNITNSETILYKLVIEDSSLFIEYEEETNLKAFKRRQFGEKTINKKIDDGSIQNFINSNRLIKRNFIRNQKLIDMQYIPENIAINILKEFEIAKKPKLSNLQNIFNYCDEYNLDKLKNQLRELL